MKIVHMADTHIGHSRYNRIDPETGLNVREKDVYDSFNRAIDMIIGISPDVVVHAGDLFDSVRPTNRALSVGIGGILRLADAGIEVVVISGNHSTPRMRETGSPFKLLEKEVIRSGAADRVHPVFRGAYKKVEIEDVIFHAIPHMDPSPFSDAAKNLRPLRGRRNVAVLHAGYMGLLPFRNSDENNEILLQSSDVVGKGFDYIALGHFHDFTKVEENIYYSGSTERFSFSEKGRKKGFLEVDLDSMDVVFHELPTRPMFELPPIDAKDLGASELISEIRKVVEGRDIEGAIVRLRMSGVGREVWSALDRRALGPITSPALHFSLEPSFLDSAGGTSSQTSHFRGFIQEFEEFYGGVAIERLDRERLRGLAERYLREVLE